MGFNELLLYASAAICIAFVFFAYKLDKERLYSAIIIFLILISVTGGKLVELFGHTTNTGNVFYASIFLATYFLIERYGKREGIRSIWVGISCVLVFTALAQLAVHMEGSPSTAGLNGALSYAFSPGPRLALASLAAYLMSQTLNVHYYIFLKKRFQDRYLWLRANVCNATAQIVDSIVFFSIAFAGIVPPGEQTYGLRASSNVRELLRLPWLRPTD